MLRYAFIDFLSKSTRIWFDKIPCDRQGLAHIVLADLLTPAEAVQLREFKIIEIDQDELEVRFIRNLNRIIPKNQNLGGLL